MEGSASAPTHPHIELEPPEWQPRAMRAGARGLCGAIAFFMLAFVFAYFYLRSLNNSHQWRPSGVDPPQRYGLAIVLLFVITNLLVDLSYSLIDPRISR